MSSSAFLVLPGWRAALAVSLFVLIAGCSGYGHVRSEGVLRFGMEDVPEGQRRLFPPPPEVPRYSYLGQLIGEQNFVESRRPQSWWRVILRNLVGQSDQVPPVELARPQGGIVDARQRVVVADVGAPAVFVFDRVGGRFEVWEYAAPGRAFVSPVSIATNEGGGFFVSDSTLGIVARLGDDGRPQPPIGEGALLRPTGIVRDGNRLYVADAQQHAVHVFSLPKGDRVAVWGSRGQGAGQFNGPTFLSIRGDELLIADTLNARIQVLDKNSGDYRREFGSRGSRLGQFMLPKGLAHDGDGNLYVVDSYFDSLLVFDPDGALLFHLGGTGYTTGNFYSPSAVWVDSANLVHVSDTFNGRVALFQFLGGD